MKMWKRRNIVTLQLDVGLKATDDQENNCSWILNTVLGSPGFLLREWNNVMVRTACDGPWAFESSLGSNIHSIIYFLFTTYIQMVVILSVMDPWSKDCTVEPRLSGPRLSGLFHYPNFFSGPVFFMNIKLWSQKLSEVKNEKCVQNSAFTASLSKVLALGDKEHSDAFSWILIGSVL